MNKAERIIRWLEEERGCTELKSKSRKYRQFKRLDSTDFYFVGKNGALRAGKSASDSVSLSHMIKIK